MGGVVHRGFARKLAAPLPICLTLLTELHGAALVAIRLALLTELHGAALVAICLALLMELLGTPPLPIRFTLLTELRHCKVDEGDEVDEGGDERG